MIVMSHSGEHRIESKIDDLLGRVAKLETLLETEAAHNRRRLDDHEARLRTVEGTTLTAGRLSWGDVARLVTTTSAVIGVAYTILLIAKT